MIGNTGRMLFTCVFFFIGGVLAAPYLSLDGRQVLFVSAAAVVVAAIIYFWGRRHRQIYVLVLFGILGVLAAKVAVEEASSPLQAWDGRSVTVRGIVVREPDLRKDKVLYVLDVDYARAGSETLSRPGYLLVRMPEVNTVYQYGDIIRVQGKLTVPRRPGNPGDFDYRAYLQRNGISVILYARPQTAEKLGVGHHNSVTAFALRIKQQLVNGLYKALGDERAQVVSGIAFGLRGGIDDKTRDTFTATGVVHILCVSGLHVGFVLGLALFTGRVLRLGNWQIVLATALLIFYLLMVGAKPSVIRATVMAITLLLAHQLGRNRDWPTALALAAFIILLANPLALYDAGFQLSFAATWGILYLGPVIVHGLQVLSARWGKTLPPACGWVVAAPLAAQLGTIPLVAYYYNLVSPVAVLVNILVMPLVVAIFILGLVSAVLGWILPLAAWMTAPATGFLLDIFLGLVGWFASLPGAYLHVATPSVPLIAAWFAVLVLVGQLWGEPGWWRKTGEKIKLRVPVKYRGWAFIVLFCVVGAGLFLWPGPGVDRLEVHFIDVGQGDCTLVRTGRQNVLIDAGGWPGELSGEPGAGEKVVVPYLRRLGIDQIDILVLTHPHEDHAGGARAVVEEIPVKMAVVAPHYWPAQQEFPAEGYLDLLATMQEKGISVRQVGAGDKLRVNRELIFEVLAPRKPLLDNFNNNSLVLRLEYGHHTFLFTGDIEQEAQARLVLSGQDLTSDVLKVPHHGSGAFVPVFLENVRPKIAVISVGHNNRFGLPKASTLDKLRSIGTEIYRTDRDGAVIIKSDSRTLEIITGRDRSNASYFQKRGVNKSSTVNSSNRPTSMQKDNTSLPKSGTAA
ncbi:MAG: DNA internalization-related competence protein ComEC/Rec2 [Peptococcaceae bacterium]|nr:DNA internalization-related competence protein ComEC/Rec2 [Peptococcaceae bacterium]